MKKQFVEKLGWLDEKEMLDFTAIAQSSPGAMIARLKENPRDRLLNERRTID